MTRKGKIYKIIANQGNECYIGSTFNTLRDRWYKHKQNYREWKEGKRGDNTTSVSLFEKYDYENCNIILIKEYDVVDREHLEMYESLWILKLKSVNRVIPFHIEWLDKIDKKQKDKKYYENNKGRFKDKWAEKDKKYYENNKEKKAEKDKIRAKIKVHCDACNVDVTKIHLKRHERSQTHINNLQKISTS